MPSLAPLDLEVEGHKGGLRRPASCGPSWSVVGDANPTFHDTRFTTQSVPGPGCNPQMRSPGDSSQLSPLLCVSTRLQFPSVRVLRSPSSSPSFCHLSSHPLDQSLGRPRHDTPSRDSSLVAGTYLPTGVGKSRSQGSLPRSPHLGDRRRERRTGVGVHGQQPSHADLCPPSHVRLLQPIQPETRVTSPHIDLPFTPLESGP